MIFRTIGRWFLALCTMLGSACSVVAPPPQKPLLVRLLIDTSSGSGVTPTLTTSLVDAILPDLIHRRGVVEFYRLDDTEGASMLGRFSTGRPSRESRSALAAFERERLSAAKQSFVLLRDTLFDTHPRSSPLALALTVMSMNTPQDAEVRYYVASDAREWSPSLGVDMECNPPSITTWHTCLKKAGLLPQGSLKGSSVYWVGVRPLMSVPGNRCPASLSLMNQTRTLWESAITNAGGHVTFCRDHEDLPLPSTGVLLFFGSSVLAWRKMRVRIRAKKDRAEGRYAFRAILHELLGPKPGLDPDHPEHQEALRRIDTLRLLVDELRTRVRGLREDLTQHARWHYLVLGTILAATAEVCAWVAIFLDAGMPGPTAGLIGTMMGTSFLVLIMFAVKHAQETGRRAYFVTSIAFILLVVIAATTVRVKNALASGGDPWEELSFAFLTACGALGPALFCEYLMRPLRAVLPLVRLRRELKTQLRENLRELRQVTGRLTREAELRRAWEWERDVLEGVYEGYNPPHTTESDAQEPRVIQFPGGK